MASSTTAPALPSDVPEEDSSCSSYSWYCDPAYSASSPASSRRARRAPGRTSRSGSGSGDAMSVMSSVAGASCPSTASFSALPQQLSAYIYQALPCKMPQTDRLARWRCAPDVKLLCIQRRSAARHETNVDELAVRWYGNIPHGCTHLICAGNTSRRGSGTHS